MPDPISKTEADWRAQLSPEQYRILREKGTEPAFHGRYCATKTPGIYHCVGCGAELFSSDAKYDSGSGWPSFTRAIEPGQIAEGQDRPGGLVVPPEVTCGRCGSHLGHRFADGPGPAGMRYCINSAALDLKAPDQATEPE